MKIDNSNQIPSTSVSTNQKSGQAASAAIAAPTANAVKTAQLAGVAVTLSTAARGQVKAGRSDAGVIDTQKVATVRSAIQDGTYVVNAEKIADKMLSNSQEILSGTTN